MPNLSTVKDELARLAKRFESKHKGEWDEASTRKSLIDGFWEALGWDTDDPREVEVEKRTEIDEHLKRADYAFLEKGRAKFLVEAKQPSKNLTRDKDAIFQVKRYVFNTPGANLGILHDFEEFIPYLIIKKPDYDLPLDGLQKKLVFGYEEYPDRADELLEIFSREAVLGGSIEALLPKGAKLERVSEIVNKEFFADLMKWRLEIAKSIAKNNPKTTDHDINSAVNHLLNRLLFLRVIEDRKIENYDPLDSAVNKWKKEELGPLMAYLIEVFKRLDPKYNGAIFAKHHVDSMIIDNKPLYECIRNLYYPQSPYQFSEMPIEVIGNAYEQYLGSVLRTTPKRLVKLEEKPEVRKAGGVYYTPKYIVDYIVEQTVGKMVEGKTPAQVSKLRILDPACGSGSFLIGAFERLQKYYIDYYTENPKKNKGHLRDDYEGNPKLDILVKKKILEDNIYGVDIDPQAVDITEFSLYVNMLEGEENLPMFAETYLPELKNNIKCGNSLIGWDIQDMDILPTDPNERQAELERINPFDWEREFPEIFAKGGFDAVIGNPPWVDIKGMPRNEVKYYFEKYSTTKNRMDVYATFIHRGVTLLETKGIFGFIIPSSLLMKSSYELLRKKILDECTISEIVKLPDNVFQGVNAETMILTFKKGISKNKIKNLVFPRDLKINSINELDSIIDSEVNSELFRRQPYLSFNIYLNEDVESILEMMEEKETSLEELVDFCLGITPYDKAKGHSQSLIKEKRYHSDIKEDDSYVPLISGAEIKRYSVERTGKAGWLSYGDWLGAPRERRFFTEPRIIIRQIVSGRIFCAFTEEDLYHTQIGFSLLSKGNVNLKYLLALLNSSLLSFYHKYRFLDLTKNVFEKILIQNTRRFPIRTIDFSDSEDVALHGRMVSLVEDMLALNKRLRETESPSTKKSIEAQIAHTDRAIDTLVYDLYALTPEEIAIVEGSTK